jgi:hypothetical protein
MLRILDLYLYYYYYNINIIVISSGSIFLFLLYCYGTFLYCKSSAFIYFNDWMKFAYSKSLEYSIISCSVMSK